MNGQVRPLDTDANVFMAELARAGTGEEITLIDTERIDIDMETFDVLQQTFDQRDLGFDALALTNIFRGFAGNSLAGSLKQLIKHDGLSLFENQKARPRRG